MSDRVMSRDLTPGTRLVWTGKNHTRTPFAVLDRRKTPAEALEVGYPFQPGWWCTDGGGLADFVIDDPKSKWVIAEGHAVRTAGRCEVHDDLAWRYEDGSVQCMHQLIVESSSDDCRWGALPQGWLRGVVYRSDAPPHSESDSRTE